MMMNLIDTPVITFNEDYLLSCCISRLVPEDLLMHFIAQVSYDAYMNGSDRVQQCDACRIVDEYDGSLSKPYHFVQEHWTVYKKCVKA